MRVEKINFIKVENKPFKNYGIPDDFGPGVNDYKAGLVGGVLPYEVRLESGNYEPWLPPGEWQKSDNGDSMSCVTFGSLNSIETEELRQTGKQVNYSDRWIAKMSGTTRRGNYLNKVLDAVREFGLVKEESYSAPVQYNWDEYHAEIPEPLLSQLKVEGQEWLKKWEVNYEWVDTDKASLMRHIKHGPLIVVVPGHLVMNFYTTQDIINYFDSYEPFKKATKEIQFAMKIVLTPKEQALDRDSLLVDLKVGDWGPQVLKLKRALERLGWFSGPGNIYDERLALVVLNFQKANLPRNGWPFWWAVLFYRGKLVDTTTREVINKSLKFRK